MENIIVNIDSQFRNRTLYPNPAFFKYDFYEKIKNCKYIRLSSIEIPNLFFTFTEKRKNIYFTLTVDYIDYKVIIMEGMYNYEQFIDEIQKNLTLAGTALNATFTIVFNDITGFITITCSKLFTANFDNNSDLYESLGYFFGFRKIQYTANYNSTTSIYSIITEGQLDVVGDHYLFLRINDYGVIINNYENIIFNESDKTNTVTSIKPREGKKNLLAKIIITNSKTEQIFDNGANFITKSHIFRQPVDISKLEIELIDPRGNTVDLLGMNYSLTLEIGTIYNSSLNDKFQNNLFGFE